MRDNKKNEKIKKFGMKVRLERTKRGLSQEALAELANLSTASLSAIERATSTPSLETVYSLADALQISPSELVDINKFDF